MNMQKKVYFETNSDRISNLPEHIRREILSYLSTRDAVRSSILSSSWRALWIELPILNLGEFHFQLDRFLNGVNLPCDDNNDAAIIMERESIARKREEFYRFLDRTLESRSSDLEMLKLYMPYYGLELKSRLDHWLDCAVNCHVRYLNLEIGGNKNNPRYSLPKRVLSVNSITKLKLTGCDLDSASLSNTQLPTLKKLNLHNVYLDEGVMEHLANSFPNIEDFTFKHCHGLTRLELFNFAKLVKVDVEVDAKKFEAIEIDAPNLLEFTYVNEGFLDYDFEVWDVEVSACKNMKRLKLVGAPLDDFDLSLLLEGLPVLEELFLYQCNSIRDICISCPKLVQLEFEHCLDLLTVVLETPNLKIFHYAEDDPLISLKSKGSALKLTEVSMYLKPDVKVDKWFVNLIKGLATLGHCERFSISISFEEDLIVPEKVRIKSRPPLHHVKHLMVELRASFIKRTPVKFIEALLWLAPRPESISIYNDFIPVLKVLKFTYEKPLKGMKKCGCWRSPVIICWRHALEHVSLENKKGDEDDTKLATFFSKARIDGNMVFFQKNAAGPKKN
ncbi:hypothetical protein BVRB_9g211720 [Beta vulgaris subsp. vulgaris]|nr:hypothetical protein BVRB_9g211720 [Beta vulgaris subsp. vulgaris]